ncbi:hypothetical protein V6N11_016982 [Hibiscus sabdariffa]|uniref:Uncharacterized protein n=2 Tax=Hibiscus sabdariffa TaxID=183260 RepID=A0ABR2TWZ5_9ROSI
METQDSPKDSTFMQSFTTLSGQSSMEDANLKALNDLLIKMILEKRDHIELLVKAYETLEAQLNQSMSLELQNEVLWVCTATQMKEKGVETERVIGSLGNRVNELLGGLEHERGRLNLVCEERDLARNEASLMKDKITVMEENERKFAEEIGTLKVECGRFLGEKDELEKVRGSMAKEKDLLEKNIKDKVHEVGTLRRKIEASEKEKQQMEMEKNEQRIKIDELEQETRELSQVALNLRKEEGILRSKVLELEKNYGEAMETNKELEYLKNKIVDFLEDFLGVKVTGESENSELQVVNRLMIDRSFNDLRTKMESTGISHAQLLTLLKNTASLLCQSKDEIDRNEKEEARVAEKKLEDEIKLIATDLEATKQAFNNTETRAQDLKQKVEVMEKTIAGWQKKVSFWKLVASATTIMSALTFAHSATRR